MNHESFSSSYEREPLPTAEALFTTTAELLIKNGHRTEEVNNDCEKGMYSFELETPQVLRDALPTMKEIEISLTPSYLLDDEPCDHTVTVRLNDGLVQTEFDITKAFDADVYDVNVTHEPVRSQVRDLNLNLDEAATAERAIDALFNNDPVFFDDATAGYMEKMHMMLTADLSPTPEQYLQLAEIVTLLQQELGNRS